MKKILQFFSSAILFLAILFSCVKAETTSYEHDGKCTGSSSCSACSNCSRCGHCSSGGSCGVCRGSSSGRSFYSAPKKHKKTYTKSASSKSSSASPKKLTNKSSASKNKIATTSKNPVKFYNGNGEAVIHLTAVSDVTNIRKAPSLNSVVIEKGLKGSQLNYLSKSNDWIKIKVKKTGTVGFVYYKNVK